MPKKLSASIQPEYRGSRVYYRIVRSERKGARVIPKKVAYLSTSPSVKKRVQQLEAKLEKARHQRSVWIDIAERKEEDVRMDIGSSTSIPKYIKQAYGLNGDALPRRSEAMSEPDGYYDEYDEDGSGFLPKSKSLFSKLRPREIQKNLEDYWRACRQVELWEKEEMELRIKIEQLRPYIHLKYRKQIKN